MRLFRHIIISRCIVASSAPSTTRCFCGNRFLQTPLKRPVFEDGCTALMFAAMSGHGPIVSELMKVGKAGRGGCWSSSRRRKGDIFGPACRGVIVPFLFF